jgi:simple sugar transport system permease protein
MTFLENALIIAVALATPLVFAAIGELIAEHAGVLNLSLEGMMLMGAAVGFRVAIDYENLWMAVAAGAAAGTALALVHAFVSVTLRANQIVSGLTLVMLGAGLSAFIGYDYSGLPLMIAVDPIAIPLLASIPFVGPILFNQDIFVYATVPLAIGVSYVLFKTRFGSWIRACGEAPYAADAAGIRIMAVRYTATLVGGLLAGVAGVYFSVVFARAWTDNLTAGRGWIALALVIFASWRPLLILPGALFFGFIDSLNFQLQSSGVQISADILGMLPYVLTLVVLMLVWRRQQRQHRGMPKALGIPYQREQRA